MAGKVQNLSSAFGELLPPWTATAIPATVMAAKSFPLVDGIANHPAQLKSTHLSRGAQCAVPRTLYPGGQRRQRMQRFPLLKSNTEMPLLELKQILQRCPDVNPRIVLQKLHLLPEIPFVHATCLACRMQTAAGSIQQKSVDSGLESLKMKVRGLGVSAPSRWDLADEVKTESS